MNKRIGITITLVVLTTTVVTLVFVSVTPPAGATQAPVNSNLLYLPLVVNNSNPSNWIDHFADSQLNSRWSWVREDNTHWSLIKGGLPNQDYLRITTQNSAPTQNNILLTPAPSGNFTVTTQVIFAPTQNYQQAALLVYQDGNNYLWARFAYINLSPVLDYYGVIGGVQTALHHHNLTPVGSGYYLRIVKQGDTYTGYWSEGGDGTNFQIIKTGSQSGILTAAFTNIQVGITAANGPVVAPEIPADFHFVQMQVPQ